ncbi:MAG: prephenate dehydratase [Bacteroidales bacterium]
MKRIAIQGGYGAFHELAAYKYFNDEEIEILPRDSFRELISSIKDHKSDFGIMAIENSLAGSILPNYNLLKDAPMRIIGEVYLRIKQNLVANHGVEIGAISEVFSHPMAILQCKEFFGDYPHIRLIESVDTALSAKDISENRTRNAGAIASRIAAEKYGLNILAAGIETNKMNYTRFLILTENGHEIEKERVNKSSIHFALAHKIGSLSKILSIFSFHEINLAKIQSMPIIGEDWEYHFYVDLEVNNYEMYLMALEAIKPFTSGLMVMGEYIKGEVYFD